MSLGCLFRVDGGPGIGNGHLMRSFALGQYLRGLGWMVKLLTAVDVTALSYWREAGIDIHFLAPDGDDVGQTLALAGAMDAQWVVLDGYNYSYDYQQQMQHDYLLLYFDDIADAKIKADVVLNQNPGADQTFVNAYPEVKRLLLGTQYTLLRHGVRTLQRSQRTNGRGLLITFGGDDRDNLALLAMLELEQYMGKCSARIISTTSPDGMDQIMALAENNPGRYKVSAPTDFAPLLVEADVLISAGGTTALEAAYLGIPSVIVTTADNQLPGVKALEKAGCILHAGTGAEAVPQAVRMALGLLDTPKKNAVMSHNAQQLIDGQGVERVAGAMVHGVQGFSKVIDTDRQVH